MGIPNCRSLLLLHWEVKMFGFKPKQLQLPDKPRYLVREGSADVRYTIIKGITLDYTYCNAIYDAQTGKYVSRLSTHQPISPLEERCKALNGAEGERVAKPYIFDSLLGQKVYENGSLQNCRDHAEALNQADREWREQAAVNRWQDIALALIRSQLQHYPGSWTVRDTGLDIEVRSLDGVLIARCETYADAAAIQALGELEFSNPLSFVPRGRVELPKGEQ